MENFEVLILTPASGRCGLDEHLFCLTHAQACCPVSGKTEFYLYCGILRAGRRFSWLLEVYLLAFT